MAFGGDGIEFNICDTIAPNIYFSNGSDYQATATGSAKDVVSFITFNSNEIYATQVKNLY